MPRPKTVAPGRAKLGAYAPVGFPVSTGLDSPAARSLSNCTRAGRAVKLQGFARWHNQQSLESFRRPTLHPRPGRGQAQPAAGVGLQHVDPPRGPQDQAAARGRGGQPIAGRVPLPLRLGLPDPRPDPYRLDHGARREERRMTARLRHFLFTWPPRQSQTAPPFRRKGRHAGDILPHFSDSPENRKNPWYKGFCFASPAER